MSNFKDKHEEQVLNWKNRFTADKKSTRTEISKANTRAIISYTEATFWTSVAKYADQDFVLE